MVLWIFSLSERHFIVLDFKIQNTQILFTAQAAREVMLVCGSLTQIRDLTQDLILGLIRGLIRHLIQDLTRNLIRDLIWGIKI